MTQLVWIHEDALNAKHPVLHGTSDPELICFVWDDEYLAAMEYGFQRLVFIYETLCEMGINVIRGDTVNVLTERARTMGVNSIRVPDSPNPAIQANIESLRSILTVEVISDEPFVQFDRPPNLRRFFSYWKSAKSHLMRP